MENLRFLTSTIPETLGSQVAMHSQLPHFLVQTVRNLFAWFLTGMWVVSNKASHTGRRSFIQGEMTTDYYRGKVSFYNLSQSCLNTRRFTAIINSTPAVFPHALVRSPQYFPQLLYPFLREYRGIGGIPAIPTPMQTSTVQLLLLTS